MRRSQASLTLALNGKWLAQPVTGTQRYALEITRRLVELHPGPVVVHVPADAQVPDWLSDRAQVRRSRLRGTAFEQLALPLASRSQLLLSLGGPAPMVARHQVATLHDASAFRVSGTYSGLFGRWYRCMYRSLARRAAGLVTVSEFSAGELAEMLAVNADRFLVAGNGVEHVDTAAPVRPDVPDGPFVLCVGTLARHKNLAPVLAELDRAKLRTIVVGVSGSRRVFEAEQPTALDHVVFAGRLADDEIVWLYRHAACLVFPSLYEGFGLPVIEAQRLGCPVVASDRASLPEVAGDGALLVDATVPEHVVAAVRRVTEDSELREQLIDRGRRNAASHSWDTSAETVHRLVTALLR